MNKGLLAGLLVAGLIAIGAFVFLASDESKVSENTTNPTNTQESTSQVEQNTGTPAPEEPIGATFTLEDVALHNTAGDCWTIIDGKVYDITTYVPRHPGGNEILLACGNDGSSLFNQRQTTDGDRIGSGTPHSSGAAAQLASFEIGILAN